MKGSWGLTRYSLSGERTSYDYPVITLSFLDRGKFERVSTERGRDSTGAVTYYEFILFGNWEVTREENQFVLRLSNEHTNNAASSPSQEEYRLAFLDDSLLVLIGGDTDTSWYQRLPLRTPTPDVWPFPVATAQTVVPAPDTLPPPKEVYLVNCADSTRKISLANGDIELTTVLFDTTARDSTRTYYSGDAIRLTDSSLVLLVDVENTYHGYEGGDYVFSKEVRYYNDYPNRNAAFHTIRSFTFSSDKRASRHNSAILFCSLASFHVLFIAPLASIDYKHGGFNSNRYFKLAGIGLGAVGVSIPLMIFSKPKPYALSFTPGDRNKHHWYFRQY